MLCFGCLGKSHTFTPLHRVDEWRGTHFQEISLENLGVSLYLHHDGKPCPNTGIRTWPKVPSEITVMHTNGIHKVGINYCVCTVADEPYQQLLDHGLFPATNPRPSTVFTFQALDQFQDFNLTSKMSAHDYCLSLRSQTDPVMPHTVPVSPGGLWRSSASLNLRALRTCTRILPLS